MESHPEPSTAAAAPRDATASPATYWRPLFAAASLKLVLHVVLGSGYGFHRDEFYYLACGRRPDWGYVDQPPLVPWLGHLVELLFGVGTLTPGELRWFSALAGAGAILLAGLMARELGGKRFAQGLAALTVLVMPLFLATGELFQTVVFDQLWWSVVLWLALRTLRTGDGRGWWLVGLAAGLGLETKHTMGLLGLGLAAGLLFTAAGRRHLRTPWPWLGGALALALLLPNLLWQHVHGWPTAEFVHNNNAWNRKEWTLAGFLGFQALFVGPGGLLLIGLGLWRACVPAGRNGERLVAWIFAVVLGTLLVLHGKHYYLGPIYPALAAAGGVAAEGLAARWTARRPGLGRWLRPAWAAATVLGALPLVPAVLPVVPLARFAGSWEYRLNHDLGEQIGWREVAAQAVGVVHGLSGEEQAQATVLTVNYSEASAIEFYEHAFAAQTPVVCGQNNYWLWGPGAREGRTVIVVGARHREWMEEMFGRVERVATIGNPWGVANDEHGTGIFVCHEPKKTLQAAWPEQKDFD